MNDEHIKVLLIEDNPGDARLIREMLAEARNVSFDLEHFDRLQAGLGRLAKGGIDVSLVDLSLPDSQGLDTVKRMHSHAPGVPMIVLTGLGDETLITKVMQEGTQDYLIKGQVDSNLLVRSIRYAIERLEQHKQAMGLLEEARAQLDRYSKELEKKVEERTRELTMVNQDLEKEAEALAASKAYTESIIQNFLDTLIVVDAEAKIKTVNPATCHLLGYTEEKLIGQPISIIFAEEEEEEEAKRVFQFLRDPENKEAPRPQDTIRNRELTYKARDGRLTPMSFNASVLTDEAGNITGVVAGAKDITEIKQAEEARRKTEEHFRKVIENIFKFVPEGLLVFTDKLNLFKENKAFEDIVKKYSVKLNFTEQELKKIIIEQVKNRIINENNREIRISKKQ